MKFSIKEWRAVRRLDRNNRSFLVLISVLILFSLIINVGSFDFSAIIFNWLELGHSTGYVYKSDRNEDGSNDRNVELKFYFHYTVEGVEYSNFSYDLPLNIKYKEWIEVEYPNLYPKLAREIGTKRAPDSYGIFLFFFILSFLFAIPWILSWLKTKRFLAAIRKGDIYKAKGIGITKSGRTEDGIRIYKFRYKAWIGERSFNYAVKSPAKKAFKKLEYLVHVKSLPRRCRLVSELPESLQEKIRVRWGDKLEMKRKMF